MKKHYRPIIASVLAMSFVFVGMGACSGEENIDDVLSKETTAIDFDLNWYNGSILFDYTAKGTYVGSDTIPSGNYNPRNNPITVNLRQGKHQLVWVIGITDRHKEKGLHFSPKSKTFIDDGNYTIQSITSKEGGNMPNLTNTNNAVFYWKKDLEVMPYLYPTQKEEFVAVTCSLRVEITDADKIPDKVSGCIKDIPLVKETAIDSKHYTLRDEALSIYANLTRTNETNASIVWNNILCPYEGLNNIQMTCDFKDINGQHIPTTPLPIITLKRGYVTTLKGPLFSGTINDWTVIEEPYKWYLY